MWLWPRFALLAIQNSQEEEKLETNLNKKQVEDPSIKMFNETIVELLRKHSADLAALAPTVALRTSLDLDIFIYFHTEKCRTKDPEKWKPMLIADLLEFDILAIPFGNIRDAHINISGAMEFAKNQLLLHEGIQWHEEQQPIPKYTQSEEELPESIPDSDVIPVPALAYV